MTPLRMGVATLNHDSTFQLRMGDQGDRILDVHTLEDCIDLVAKLPTLGLATRIYHIVYHP